MANAIKKTPDARGIYRFVYDIEVAAFPTADWEIDPDILSVTAVPQRYWKYDGTNVVVEMPQAEKDAVDASMQDQLNVGIAGTLGFEKNGICKNKWLGFGYGKPSNVTPYVAVHPMQITGITFMNRMDSVETDIEIYRNNVLVHTWEIRNARSAWVTEGLHGLTFSPGDHVGVFLRDRGTDPRHCIVTIHYATWNHIVGEGSKATLL